MFSWVFVCTRKGKEIKQLFNEEERSRNIESLGVREREHRSMGDENTHTQREIFKSKGERERERARVLRELY